MIDIKREGALLGLQTAVDLLTIKSRPRYKIRDRYYIERSKAIRKRGAKILSAQKVRLAKGSGIATGAITRETEAGIELDMLALIHEDEVLRYNAAIKV